jgi:lipooligosaccharide transport system permease protein
LPTTAIFEGARDALLFGSVPMKYLMNLVLSAALLFVIAVIIFDRKISE